MTQDRSFTFTIDRRSNLDTMGAMAGRNGTRKADGRSGHSGGGCLSVC